VPALAAECVILYAQYLNPNNWEQGLVEKKAIYVECAGSLPNVPVIDSKLLLEIKWHRGM